MVCFDSCRSTLLDVPEGEGGLEETRGCPPGSGRCAGRRLIGTATGMAVAILLQFNRKSSDKTGTRQRLAASIMAGRTRQRPPVSVFLDGRQSIENISRRAVPLIGLAAWQRALEVPTSFDPIVV
jgi:hypothetical protein